MEARRRTTILIGPSVLLLIGLFVLPMAIMVVFSFRAGTFGPARQEFTLANYATFLTNSAFTRLLLQSSWLAFLTAFFSVLLAYPVAYYLSLKAGEIKVELLTLLIVPGWTSYLLRILAWKTILGSHGMFNSFLLWMGLTEEALPVLLYNSNAVLITLVYVWIPFAALPIFSGLERIDQKLLEAASDLGSRSWETFLRVTLPLSLPGVAASFFFVFIPTLGEWVTPALVGGSQGIMYGNLIQDQFARALNWPMGAVLSLAMLVLVLGLTIIFTRFVNLTRISGL